MPFSPGLAHVKKWPIYPFLGTACFLGILNLLVFTRFSYRLAHGLDEPSLTLQVDGNLLSFLVCNLTAMGLLYTIRARIVQPWRRMTMLLRHASASMIGERGALVVTPLSMRAMVTEMTRFTEYATDAASKHRELKRELDISRRMLAQINVQQQAIVASTNREIIEQYRSVLAYANYLDEHIQRTQDDPQLRYDFDDVCESSFNLKLMAQSLELMRHSEPKLEPVTLSRLLQQTMLALAPSLERRSMKLSTLGVDTELEALTDVGLLAHAIWMMLLGTIRYAAAESTLRLRCLPTSDGNQAIVSMVISELSPGQMTPDERHAHLARQLQHVTPHMFAETIRLHGNVQLAELMLVRVGGQVNILPISSYACEISLVLPISKK